MRGGAACGAAAAAASTAQCRMPTLLPLLPESDRCCAGAAAAHPTAPAGPLRPYHRQCAAGAMS